MELTQLRYFLEVAQTQHMTESAEKLHIAQPALSQAMKRLEKDLGVPLFAAKGRNIVLTEFGVYLQKQLIPVMERLDKLPEDLKTMANLSNETIHLNVLTASALVTEAIIAYQKEHTKLHFQFLQNTNSDLFDIEITTKLFYQVTPERSQNQFSFSEKIFLAVPNNEKYANKTSVSLREMAHEGFISLMGSKQFRAICDTFCHRAGVTPKVVFESDSPAVVRNMIAANFGVGFWPEFTWGQIDRDKILLLEISDPVCRRDIVFTQNCNKTDNQHVESFFLYLKQFFEQYKRVP